MERRPLVGDEAEPVLAREVGRAPGLHLAVAAAEDRAASEAELSKLKSAAESSQAEVSRIGWSEAALRRENNRLLAAAEEAVSAAQAEAQQADSGFAAANEALAVAELGEKAWTEVAGRLGTGRTSSGGAAAYKEQPFP